VGFKGRRAAERLRVVMSVIVALSAVALLVRPLNVSFRDLVTSATVFFLCVWVAARPTPQAAFLPLARTLVPGLGPVAACVVLAFYSDIAIRDFPVAAVLLVCVLDVALMACVSEQGWFGSGRRPLRLAVVGSSQTAAALALELRALRAKRYQIVGFVHDDEGPRDPHAVLPYLGRQSTLATIVAVNQIDLLLLSAEVPRLGLFEEIARSCLNLPVRVLELSSFYEETFGHVALGAINASWFQYLMHPRYSRATPGLKRAFDLLIAVPVLLVFAPIISILAALVRADGGPVLYRQTRIGEGGRAFVIYKLRSMRGGSDDAGPQWSSRSDDRVTRVGTFMRRTHLDEFPQLLNVIKGEMSIVGPRPEQPPVVKSLELAIPFYSRRHLVRPGITGWAQVQCGYAGTQHGSALKACYDLYYIKHRSVRLDCLIILETVRTLFADKQWPELSTHRAFAFAESGGRAAVGVSGLPGSAGQDAEPVAPNSTSAWPLGA
jgi:exopolysaccharide biosynthesis polyprenyl glycosylphosphotransferase